MGSSPQQELEPEPKKLKSSPENQCLAGEDADSGDPSCYKKTKYKRRKIAIFFAYCGAGYQGMQKNPGARTIEADLEKALFLAGALPEQDLGDHRRVDWARSSRTDKGVSAVGQVISGRFIVDPPGLVHRLNSNLCTQIRVFGYVRATSSFSAKKLCDRRRYAYLLPVFALDPASHRDRESVLASVGTGHELSRCVDCSERGRKVGKQPENSSMSSVFSILPSVSVKKIQDVDSVVDRGILMNDSCQSGVVFDKQEDDSLISSFSNSSGTVSVKKVDEIDPLFDDRGISSNSAALFSDSSGSNRENVNYRGSELTQMQEIENAGKISAKNSELLSDSCLCHLEIRGSRVSETAQLLEIDNAANSGDLLHQRIISFNGCDSLNESCYSNGKKSKSRVYISKEMHESKCGDSVLDSYQSNAEITKSKVLIPEEMNEIGHTNRSSEESEPFLVNNCRSVDAEEEECAENGEEEKRQCKVELNNAVKNFRYGEKEMGIFNRILRNFVGTHNFHNFTTRTKADDPSSKRFIVSFSADKVIEVDGIEFVKCEVVGQSFMLHQIRKMIGLAVAVMRGCAPEYLLETALQKEVKVNVPTAPEVGLHLEECMFTQYNKRWKDSHEEVTLADYKDEAESFKTNMVYPHIASVEHKEGAVALWLHSLNHRNYPDLRPEPRSIV